MTRREKAVRVGRVLEDPEFWRRLWRRVNGRSEHLKAPGEDQAVVVALVKVRNG